MEVLIFIGIVVAIAIWSGISSLIGKIQDGKKAHDNLMDARSEVYAFKKHCDSLEEEHKQELHKLRKMIEQQGNIVHDIKQDSKPAFPI